MSKYAVAGAAVTGAAIVAMLAVSAGPAAAQDQWQQQVNRQLESAANFSGTRGYVQTHGPWTRSLRAGENASWSMRLEAGVEYRMVGVCDNDCSDFDLKLYRGGTVVVQDVAVDDVPMFNFTPSVTGDYTLQAIMVTCRVNPCRTGIAAWGRRGATTTATTASTSSNGSADRWEQQVINQLNRAADITGSSGFVQTHGPWVASLRQGERRSWTIRLNGGASYRIVGACDNDCSDVDLKLYAGSTVVTQDVQVDDVPVLTFTPATTRDYTLEVIMATCRVNPCRYGVAAYGR